MKKIKALRQHLNFVLRSCLVEGPCFKIQIECLYCISRYFAYMVQIS